MIKSCFSIAYHNNNQIVLSPSPAVRLFNLKQKIWPYKRSRVFEKENVTKNEPFFTYGRDAL